MKNKISLAIFLLFTHLGAWAQIGGDYNPDNPSDPGSPTLGYTLSLKATPSDGGSFNTTNTKVSVGERYNLRAYPNTDFAFVAWLCEGDTLSKSASYDYTMPSHNVDITGVFTYRPSSPSDPTEQALKYQLSLSAVPINSGSFNISNERLAVGSNNSLRAYANTDFVFKHWMIGDSVLSVNANMDYVMPSHNVQIVGVFEYNPASPANPNRNHWDKESGHVIVDDFTPGYLSSAISSAINGSNSSDVNMITVSGRINSNDFGIANSYSNCTLLDLSRVTGVTEVPSYAFDYTNLESVYLPATIEKIGTRAFAECAKLSSLTIYAMTPPTLESNVFQGVPDGLVVYVPAAAITQYQEADTWKDFTLLPIQEDIRSISVSLPEGENATDYAQMGLELTNTKSGQRMHYVMTDRQTYTFANIIRNTSWNVTLRNERGDVFGRIENVEVKDEDISVIFSSLSKPQSVVLSVLTPEGQDVTAQTQVTWTDAKGNYLAQGISLTGLPKGYQTTSRVVLSQELAMAYNTPQPVDYTLTDGNNRITCQLSAIPQVKISGKVKDASTGLPLSGAVISASQTFGGKYSKTLNAKTDDKGVFSLDIANVPTSVAFAASDYISQTVNCDSLLTGAGEVTLPDVLLKTITGATISLDFTYTSCDGETQNWYSDYQNVSYELFNATQDKAISQYNVQYPQIVLLEEVADGDVLRLTATSRTNAFMPVTTTATIAEQKAGTTFAVVELGKIQSSFTSTGNAAVVGSLYDADGKLLKTYNYANATLTISDLVDGKYTLVSMGSSRLFNTIYDLSQLPQTGLVEGMDYVQNSVEVKSGQVSAVSINEIPTLDESKLYYTGDNTSFTVNKPSIVAGNYLTLTGRIDFKPAYATSVSNVQMIVDLPESCEFVENSVMVGNSTSSYTLNGHQITIPMARYTDRVRFCIIPTLGGEYAPSAFVQFDINGETVTQPIGSIMYEVKNLSIKIPSTAAKTTIPVSGSAVGGSTVEIYDNGVLVGQTNSLGNGTWSTIVELNNPYNLSLHEIYAKVTTSNGIDLLSETKKVMYDMNAIQVSKVIMYHWNPEMHQMFESVFDFQNPSSKPNQWTVYYPKKQFTYTVDFTNNSPDKVTNVILYVHAANGQIVPLNPIYDEEKDIWVADIDMGNRSDNYYPVNVSVDFDFINEKLIDTKELGDASNDYLSLSREFEKSAQNFDEWLSKNDSTDAIDDIENTGSNNWASVIDEKIRQLTDLSMDDDHENSYQYFSNMTDEELDSYLGHLQESDLDIELANMESAIDSIMHIMSSKLDEIQELGDGTKISMSTCEGLSPESLTERGFVFIPSTNGSGVYVLISESTSEVVDFDNNQYTVIRYSSLLTNLARSSFRANSRLDEFNEIMDKINSLYHPIAEAWKNTNKKLYNFVENFKNVYVAKSFDFGRKKAVYNSKLTKLNRLKSELKSLNSLSLEYHLKLGEIQDYQKEVKAAKKLMDNAGRLKALAGTAYKSVKPLPGFFTKNLPLVKYANAIYTYLSVARRYQKVYMSIPDPCKDDQTKAESLQSDCVKEAWATEGVAAIKLGTTAILDLVTFGAVATAAETGGVSLLAAAGTAIVNILANLVIDNAFNKQVEKSINAIIAERNKLECVKKCGTNGYPPCPDDHGGSGNSDSGGTGSGSPNDNVKIDPSGYVYEGVSTNRIEGATATIYYKEEVEDMYGDLHENIVKWDAEEYAQENPLFTDENGMYRWDVPQGLWQVKFEKEGYETTYSEWLPVPPPQLDVNIAMKQNRQPEVKAAHAYEDAVEVEFDKYMMPELLTAENIMVMQNGTAVEGTVELQNEEVSYEGEAETFASKIRFNAAQPFTEQEITLMVNNRVKSYAGIRMQDNYQQTFTIEQEIKQIVSDSVVTVGYGNSTTLVVSVLPASASKEKKLTVKTSSPIILGVETEQVTIDNDGKAEITVSGELPGTAALTFAVEGTDKTAMTIANVEQKVIATVAAPTANIASGSVVSKGTAVMLSCETDNATIYYTLDGSCPCDNTDARKVYDGTPIIINETMTIKAMAMAPDMYESEVAEFSYIVDDATGVIDITVNGHIKISPLPIHDRVNISAGDKAIKKVTITTLNGITVISTNKVSKTVTLDMSLVATGIYIINIQTEDSVYSRKVLKVQ